MVDFRIDEPLSAQELRQLLLMVGAKRYHSLHPFHQRLHAGELTKTQVQAWALNRFAYQAAIPRKDAALMARTDDPELRRHWRQRVIDHDGDIYGDETGDQGGIRRWLALTTALGFDPERVARYEGVLPATRFAVEAYVRFVAEKSLLEAVASSLTELFAPSIIAQRVEGMLKGYDFVDEKALQYFSKRVEQAPRDSDFALNYVLERARTVRDQQAVVNALLFKCDVLWAQLDALYFAYVNPGLIPPGAFRGDGEEDEAADFSYSVKSKGNSVKPKGNAYRGNSNPRKGAGGSST